MIDNHAFPWSEPSFGCWYDDRLLLFSLTPLPFYSDGILEEASSDDQEKMTEFDFVRWMNKEDQKP